MDIQELQEQLKKLSAEERAYFRDYCASVKNEAQAKLLLEAAEIVVGLHGGELPFADLLQEANVELFLALERRADESDAWVLEEVRRGLGRVIEEQKQRHFGDDCLIAKVEKLESAVRELSEDEDGEMGSQFSVNELAIILDMDPEEMRDILRLTGDDR